MRRVSVVLGFLLTAIATACLGNVGAPETQNPPYAVFWGRIGAPSLTANIAVVITAYQDSAQAVKGGDTGAVGGVDASTTGIGGDTGNTFTAYVYVAKPGTYFVNVFATGQGHGGFVSSLDTIRALPVLFDSIGGGQHDSVPVYDTLP